MQACWGAGCTIKLHLVPGTLKKKEHRCTVNECPDFGNGDRRASTRHFLNGDSAGDEDTAFMRKDAELNRQKLIDAASNIMRNQGGDVPMELIAERANLTRGTLYRNFPHRQAMYEAVLENDLRTMSEHSTGEREADPLDFIRQMTELMMVYDKFLVSLAAMADYDSEKNEARMVASIAAPLAAAKAEGLLHPRLTGGDILMACRMLASHVRLDGQADFTKAFRRRLELILRGIGATLSENGSSVSQSAPQRVRSTRPRQRP